MILIQIIPFAKEVTWSVLFVCQSVSRITEKVMSPFHWNLLLWKNWLTYGVASVSDTDCGSQRSVVEWRILRNLLAFLIQSPINGRFLRYLAKRLTPTRAVWWTSGSRLVRKSGFEFPDHFCLRLWPWQRFALSDYSLVNVVAFCCFLFRKHSEWRRRDYWRSRGVVGYTETPEVTETVTQSHNLPPGRVYHY